MGTPRKTPENMTEYRLAMVETAVEKISASLVSIDKNLGALATLESRHAEIEKSVARNFERLEALEDGALKELEHKQSALDDEFKKWFNRGAGIASVVSILFMTGGGLIYSQLAEIAGAVKKVEKNSADIERQKVQMRAIMKKIGVDLDYVPE